MSDTNNPADVPEALSGNDPPPHAKRHCPVCGSEELLKFSGKLDDREVEGSHGVALLASLFTQVHGVHVYGSKVIQFGYSFIDMKTGKDVETNTTDPFLRVCLSCGYLMWHLTSADRDRIRDLRDELMNNRDQPAPHP